MYREFGAKIRSRKITFHLINGAKVKNLREFLKFAVIGGHSSKRFIKD